MSYWYRIGTVSVVNGSKSIVGVGTLWAEQAAAGDLFTLDGNQFYEIETVTDDTHIELKTNYLEAAAGDQNYAIIRNFASTLTATLAARLADLLNRWHTREDEWYDWHNGTVTGGPESDGRYPFTDAAGDTVLIACPARMAELNGYTYIAYASSDAGAGFSNTFNPELNYIAILRVTDPIETPVASDFAGLWKNYKGATGAQGAQGETGSQGLQGETGLQGAAGIDGTDGTNGTDGLDITWKGAYAAGTAYVINDAVSYNGASYICKLATTGNAPTNTTYWDLMAQKGSDGAGAGDVIGPAASVDSHVAAFDGTTGKLIKDSGLVFPAATAENDFLMAGADPFAWTKKTLQQTRSILGSDRWTNVPTANFTATPASTSTITMGVDMTGSIKVGMSLRATHDGIVKYGRCGAITANLLTWQGPPLDVDHDVTALSYGGGTSRQVLIIIPGLYEDADNHDLIQSDLNSNLIWKLPTSYCVHYEVYSKTHDTHATHGKASIEIAGADVNSSADGLAIAADATWYSTGVDINLSNYDINPGEEFEVTAHKGGNGDATHLSVHAFLVTP
jgi:hypothetical protein